MKHENKFDLKSKKVDAFYLISMSLGNMISNLLQKP